MIVPTEGLILLNVSISPLNLQKSKASKLPSKYAVQQVGLQPDALWVMGSDTHLSQAGEILDVESRSTFG